MAMAAIASAQGRGGGGGDRDDGLASVFMAARAMLGVSRIKRKLTAKLGSKKITISDDHLRRLMAKATGSSETIELNRPALEKLFVRINLDDPKGQANFVFESIDKNGDGSIDLAELFAALSAFPHIATAIHRWSASRSRKARKQRLENVRLKRVVSAEEEGVNLSGIERHVSASLDGQTVSISDFELEQLIAVVDDDNSGTLDMEEVVEMFEHIEIEDAREKAQQIFEAMDASGDGEIEISELFETLVAFPDVIRAISDANLLFEAESDEDAAESTDEDDVMSDGSATGSAPLSPRIVSPRAEEKSVGFHSRQASRGTLGSLDSDGRNAAGCGGGGGAGTGGSGDGGDGGGGTGTGRGRSGSTAANGDEDDGNFVRGATSFFVAQARISPPPQLRQFTRGQKLRQLESKTAGLRSRPASARRWRGGAAAAAARNRTDMRAAMRNPHFPKEGSGRCPWDPKAIRPNTANSAYRSTAEIDNALYSSGKRVPAFHFSQIDRFTKTKQASKTVVNLPANFSKKAAPAKIRGTDWSVSKTERQDPRIWAARFDVDATFVATDVRNSLSDTGIGVPAKSPKSPGAVFPHHTRDKGVADPDHFMHDTAVRGTVDGPTYDLDRIRDRMEAPSSNFGAMQSERLVFGHDQRACYVARGGDSPGPHNQVAEVPAGKKPEKFSPVCVTFVDKPTSPRFSFAKKAFTPKSEGRVKFPTPRPGSVMFMSGRFNVKQAGAPRLGATARPTMPGRPGTAPRVRSSSDTKEDQ